MTTRRYYGRNRCEHCGDWSTAHAPYPVCRGCLKQTCPVCDLSTRRDYTLGFTTCQCCEADDAVHPLLRTVHPTMARALRPYLWS